MPANGTFAIRTASPPHAGSEPTRKKENLFSRQNARKGRLLHPFFLRPWRLGELYFSLLNWNDEVRRIGKTATHSPTKSRRPRSVEMDLQGDAEDTGMPNPAGQLSVPLMPKCLRVLRALRGERISLRVFGCRSVKQLTLRKRIWRDRCGSYGSFPSRSWRLGERIRL